MLVVCGYFLRENLRKLSRGLVLIRNGFEYDGQQWRWSEIRRIAAVKSHDDDGGHNTFIALTMHPGYAPHGNPVWTEIDVTNFGTGGEPLEHTMRRWLKRYGTPTRIDTEPAGEPEVRGPSDGR
jgi:hypothetical protein